MRASITAARLGDFSRQADGSASLDFRFAANDPVFVGHFPKQPLVPGIFQPEMARMGAEWLLGEQFAIREITKAKFLRPVVPSEVMRMILKVSVESEVVGLRATFSVGGQPAGETVLKLAKANGV
jgi:3-hydroxymyristoyl/3-hydroxydecanoyl-(acyl carrier protein) dehydratase